MRPPCSIIIAAELCDYIWLLLKHAVQWFAMLRKLFHLVCLARFVSLRYKLIKVYTRQLYRHMRSAQTLVFRHCQPPPRTCVAHTCAARRFCCKALALLLLNQCLPAVPANHTIISNRNCDVCSPASECAKLN